MSIRPKVSRIFGSCLAIFALAAALVLAANSPAKPTKAVPAPKMAAAAATVTNAYGYVLKASPGLWSLTHTEMNGSLNNNGVLEYCVNYKGRLYLVQPNGTATYIPGMSLTTSRQIFYVINRYGQTSSRTQAAAVNVAVNLLSGNANWAYDWSHYYSAEQYALDHGVGPLAGRFRNEGLNFHGPYVTTIKITKTALVGQHGTAAGKVNSAVHQTTTTYYGVPGISLHFAMTNAVAYGVLPTRTNSYGTFSLAFTRTGTGTVTITVTASLPNIVGVVSQPPAGYQHLVGRAPNINSSARTSYWTGPKNVTAKQNCSGICNGQPPVTVCGSNAPGGYIIAYGSNVVGTAGWTSRLQLAAGASGCRTFTGVDGQTIQFAYRYYLGSGNWTAWVRLAGSIKIICPTQPPVDILIHCTASATGVCTKTLTVSVPTANDSPNTWFVTLTANGVVTTTSIAPGASFVAVTVPIKGVMAVTSGAIEAGQTFKVDWLPATTF